MGKKTKLTVLVKHYRTCTSKNFSKKFHMAASRPLTGYYTLRYHLQKMDLNPSGTKFRERA